MMSLFVKLRGVISEMMFFYFICFSVISRIIGIVVIVSCMKFFGNDKCIYCRYKLSYKLLIFKIKNVYLYFY